MKKSGSIILETSSGAGEALPIMFDRVGDWLADSYGLIDKKPDHLIEFERGFRSPHWSTDPTINISSGKISFSDLGDNVEIKYDLDMPEGFLALFLLAPLIFIGFLVELLPNPDVSFSEKILGVLVPACFPALAWLYMKRGHRKFVKHLERVCAKALETGAGVADDYHRLFRIWFLLGWPAFGALIVVFCLMVAKPTW